MLRDSWVKSILLTSSKEVLWMSFFQKAANLENTPIVHLSNLGHLAHKEAHEKAHGMAHCTG